MGKQKALAPRLIEIVYKIADGQSNKDILESLQIGRRTLESHLSKLRSAAGAKNDRQLVIWCIWHKRYFNKKTATNMILEQGADKEFQVGRKFCIRCDGYLDKNLFYKNRAHPDGLDHICKMHRNQVTNLYRQKPEEKIKHRERIARRRLKRQKEREEARSAALLQQ